jgi:hypothetical protein
MNERAFSSHWHTRNQSSHQPKHLRETSVKIEVFGDLDASYDGLDLRNTRALYLLAYEDPTHTIF